MKDLSFRRIGVQGKLNNENKKVGYIGVFSKSEKIISVDNYSGRGDTYQQRDEPIICIFDGEDCIFEGTHEQLIKKLTNKN